MGVLLVVLLLLLSKVCNLESPLACWRMKSGASGIAESGKSGDIHRHAMLAGDRFPVSRPGGSMMKMGWLSYIWIPSPASQGA